MKSEILFKKVNKWEQSKRYIGIHFDGEVKKKTKKKNAGDFESVLERFPFYSKTLEKDEK